MKTAVSVVGLICVVTLACASLPSAAIAAFTSQDMGDYILWSQDSTHTYFQQYKADYSWKDSTNSSSGFNYMGKLKDVSILLFDGSFHQFTDNNYSYEYWASGTGVWQNESLNLNQFAYDYNSGQWYDQGNWGGWAELGSEGLSTAFMGGGGSTWMTLGDNWSYLFDGTYGIWKNANINNVSQYAYNYANGNWYDQGNWGGWAALGNPKLSASFLGDTTSHTLGGNWSYVFDGTYGLWNRGSLNQYAYNYTTGNWYDQGNWGGWAGLGNPNLSASFMGDGGSHWLSGAWTYRFDGTYGYWNNGSLNQYAYDYSTGNWYSQGNWGGWGSLGPGALSASFMGDGGSHWLSAAWSYLFDGAYGYWNNGSRNQYAYNYTGGNWYDQGLWGGWATLGNPNLSASFLGDTTWHVFDSTWSYMYDGTFGYWKNASMGLSQFAYDYNSGQWFDQGTFGGWAPLTFSGGYSATFMGDGNWHYTGNSWYYALNPADGTPLIGTGNTAGYWKDGADLRFAYDYMAAAWYDTSHFWLEYCSGWNMLNGPGPEDRMSAEFIGNGNTRQLQTSPQLFYYYRRTDYGPVAHYAYYPVSGPLAGHYIYVYEEYGDPAVDYENSGFWHWEDITIGVTWDDVAVYSNSPNFGEAFDRFVLYVTGGSSSL